MQRSMRIFRFNTFCPISPQVLIKINLKLYQYFIQNYEINQINKINKIVRDSA